MGKYIRMQMMRLISKRRVCYLIAIATLVVLGLLSRQYDFIHVEVGDGIWAMMVFCLGRFLFPNIKLEHVAAMALAFSFIDEFAQLISWSWLVEIRSTTLGHLILGQGFEWIDLVAYTIGIIIAYIPARFLE